MFKKNLYLLSILVIYTIILTLTTEASEEITVPTFSVVSTRFVSELDGVNGYSWTAKKDKSIQGIIVTVRCENPIGEKTSLWAADFGLKYQHRNTEEWDRGIGSGISFPSLSEKDDRVWLIGKYVNVSTSKENFFFDILFPLEKDVDEITLQWAQPADTPFKINRNPNLTAYVITNLESKLDLVEKSASILRTLGFEVDTGGSNLSEDTIGNMLLYSVRCKKEYAEEILRKISEDLNNIKISAKSIAEERVTTGYDILLWLGK